MGGTHIVVFKLKELIRTGIFALVGLLLIIALVWFMLPKNNRNQGELYVPGTYMSQIILHSKPVSIEVTVTKDAITKVEMKEMQTAQELFYPLFKPTMENISKEIIGTQSTIIASTPENAVTSKILVDAVNLALSQAKGVETANQ